MGDKNFAQIGPAGEVNDERINAAIVNLLTLLERSHPQRRFPELPIDNLDWQKEESVNEWALWLITVFKRMNVLEVVLNYSIYTFAGVDSNALCGSAFTIEHYDFIRKLYDLRNELGSYGAGEAGLPDWMKPPI